ncbi:2OG-Fe(II) oxygenase superfamily-domain-containing protein [Gaertneriomyces semiglobifer]|nr:2OG-Fe(II) oxygenase superfamily-domain-containing protein [Gaertneriomyces semiglobifer]
MARKKRHSLPPPPDSPAWINQTAFRIAERTWKRRELPDSVLETLIDPRSPDQWVATGALLEIPLDVDPREACIDFGYPEAGTRDAIKAYKLGDYEGLLIIPNLFSAKAQRKLIRHCLRNYTCFPNVTNLDTHWRIPKEGLWKLHESGKKIHLEMRHDGSVGEDGYSSEEEVELPIDSQDQTDSSVKVKYNWSTKEYHLDRRPPFPALIAALSTAIVEAISSTTLYPASSYIPEAGIVNFYQLRDALMAHQDRSEENVRAPLVSFSLGNEGIFLFGTEEKKDKPVAIKLTSGDVCVMYGKGRRAFHSVPRILENTLPPYLARDAPLEEGEEEWALFGEYMTTTRVNINVRQVY